MERHFYAILFSRTSCGIWYFTIWEIFLLHFEIVLHKVYSNYQRKCFDKLRKGFINTSEWSQLAKQLHIFYIDIFIFIHKNDNSVWDNKVPCQIVKARFATIDSTVLQSNHIIDYQQLSRSIESDELKL